PQQLAVLGAGRNLQRDRAARRRDLHLPAESGGRERDGDLDDQIIAAPLVGVGLRDPCDDDPGAVRTAVPAALALALEPDLRAVFAARLDLHRVRAQSALATRALALRARLLDHGAVAAAARTRLGQREQALALGGDAAAVALRADDGSGSRLRAGA